MYSGGGLYLGNTIAIVISISNAAARFDEATRNVLFQADWRSIAYSEISHEKYLTTKSYNPQEIKNKWIIDKKYKKSIIEVIGKAIGDCLTNMNEFAPENICKGGIITFKDTDPSSYLKKNWNAVILYNYVYFIVNKLKREKQEKMEKEEMEKEYIDRNDVIVIHLMTDDDKKISEQEDIERRKHAEEIANWLKKIKDYFVSLNKNIDTSKIDKAWGDIRTYNDALQIYDTLSEDLDYLMDGKEPAIHYDDRLNRYEARSSIIDYQGGHRVLYTPIYSFVNNLTPCISAIERESQILRYGIDVWCSTSDCGNYTIYGKKFRCKTAQNIMSLFNGLGIEITNPTQNQIKKYDAQNLEYAHHVKFWDRWDGCPEKIYSDEFYNRQFVPLFNE